MTKSFTNLSRTTALGLLLLTASTLGGCAYDDIAADDSYQPYGGSLTHPITVAKGPITMEVSSINGTLQPAQVNAVQGFTHQAMLAGVSPLTISRPSGGGASTRVAGEIASLLVQQGVTRDRVRFASYAGGSTSPVRLSYVSTYAKTVPCGIWNEDSATETSENNLMTNHGCAVQANIAAMVAYPETLVVPTTASMGSASGQSTAIESLKTPNTAAAISLSGP